MAGPFQVGRNRVVIDAPAQQVFDYLADLSHILEWSGEPDFRITGESGRQLSGLGASLRREKSGFMRGPLIVRGGMSDNPLLVVKVSTVTVFEPYTAMVIETRNSFNGLLHSIEKFNFGLVEGNGDTHVTLVSEVEPMVPSIYIGPVYAIRIVRNLLSRLFGSSMSGLLPLGTPGPHLSRIKERVEAIKAGQT